MVLLIFFLKHFNNKDFDIKKLIHESTCNSVVELPYFQGQT